MYGLIFGVQVRFGDMKITKQMIKEKFTDLLSEKITFEEASVWASEIMFKDEHDEIEFEPNEDISKLFSGITYLLGVNLEISPNKYLHTLEDVQIKFDQLFD